MFEMKPEILLVSLLAGNFSFSDEKLYQEPGRHGLSPMYVSIARSSRWKESFREASEEGHTQGHWQLQGRKDEI